VAGVVFYGFTAIFEPIADELGWSYTQISLAASIRGLEAGLLAPLIGILTDRWGPRRLVFAGVVFTALGFVLLGYTTSLLMFYGAFTLIAIGMSCATMTVLMTAVANWFHKKIGTATGIAVCGFGLSGFLVPLIVAIIEIYGWRMTMNIVALGMLAVGLPLSFVFRHKPEQYGYLPDGAVEEPANFANDPGLTQTAEVEVGPREAFKTSTFWLISLGFMYHMLAVSSIVTHVMPYLSSVGIARSRSSLVAMAIPLMSVAGRLGLGWLGDELDKRLVSAAAFAMMGLSALCFGYTSAINVWLLIPFVALLGLGYGGCNSLRPSLIREYFGRASFGTILGLIMGINSLGGIIGPVLAGWSYDTWGSYQGIWLIFAGLSIPAIISTLLIPPAGTATELPDKA